MYVILYVQNVHRNDPHDFGDCCDSLNKNLFVLRFNYHLQLKKIENFFFIKNLLSLWFLKIASYNFFIIL